MDSHQIEELNDLKDRVVFLEGALVKQIEINQRLANITSMLVDVASLVERDVDRLLGERTNKYRG